MCRDNRKAADAKLDGSLRGRAYATRDELRDLGQELRKFRISETTRLLLARLASYPPNIRLLINLKVVLDLMRDRPLYSVLKEGLTKRERAALVELDLRGLSIKGREIAHGLLNVHERWLALKAFRGLFRRAIEVRDRFLAPVGLQENADDDPDTIASGA